MADEECIHGMTRAWCASCTGTEGAAASRTGEYGFHGGRSKQDLLDDLCDLLDIRRQPIGVGSSLPSDVFEAAARQAGVQIGSMPETGEAIANKAGLTWGPDCDSRGNLSGGGSTVTRVGLEVMLKSLRRLSRS
jgi:hypothetical protein